MTKIDKNNIKRIYNYSLRSIAAFCLARKDLKTLCLKFASEPLFLILAFMQFQSFIVLIVKVRPPSVFRLYLGYTKFAHETEGLMTDKLLSFISNKLNF